MYFLARVSSYAMCILLYLRFFKLQLEYKRQKLRHFRLLFHLTVT
jgi:hypothetical protein